MRYTREYFTKLAEDLSNTGSHPTVVDKMVKVREAPDEERISLSDAVHPEALKELGVPVPDSFRVSPRTFEKPTFVQSNGVQNPGLEPGSDAESSWKSYGSMPNSAYDTSAWGAGSDALPETPQSPEIIRQTIYRAVLDIADLVLGSQFSQAITEMYDLPLESRPQFVMDVFLNSEELNRRGIVIPETMNIQRSTFYDGRPTLFCISKREQLSYPWRKITITFDSETEEDAHNTLEEMESC